MSSSESPTNAQQTGLYHPQFPEHWDRCSLYSLATWVNGLAFRDISFSSHGLPVIKIAEIKGGISGQTKFTEETFDESVRVTAGDLLFSWSGQPETSIDAFWWRGPDGWLNQHVFRVTPQAGVDICFLYYLLRYLNRNFVGIARNKQTTGLGHVTKRDLQQIEAARPEPNEQRGIAGVLGALDDKIEQNRRTARALERLAQAIFRAWFVDFEPVKAKTAGATAFPSMPQPVFDALPTRFVNSAIGPVPEEWEVGKLGDHCDINQRNVRAGEIHGLIEYVDIASVTVGRLTGIQRVRFSDAPSRARRRVQHGDTIWSCVRPNHRSYLFIHSPPDERIVSTGFAVLSPSRFGASFLHEITTQPEFVHYLVSNADGSAYPAVRPDHFASATVVVPPQLLRDTFEWLTMPLRDSLAAAERESAKLAEIRDYLLPKLLSGRVRVEAAHG
jgi:type I restriction enzyme, S subunit